VCRSYELTRKTRPHLFRSFRRRVTRSCDQTSCRSTLPRFRRTVRRRRQRQRQQRKGVRQRQAPKEAHWYNSLAPQLVILQLNVQRLLYTSSHSDLVQLSFKPASSSPFAEVLGELSTSGTCLGTRGRARRRARCCKSPVAAQRLRALARRRQRGLSTYVLAMSLGGLATRVGPTGVGPNHWQLLRAASTRFSLSRLYPSLQKICYPLVDRNDHSRSVRASDDSPPRDRCARRSL
jgi:hypothetical protein